MALLPIVDSKKTERRVKLFLKGHCRRVLRAGRTDTIQSPQITGMPGSQSILPTAENHIVMRLQAQQEVGETMRVIEHLDHKSQVILTQLYLQSNPKYDWEVMNDLGYGKTQYTEFKHWALLSFADGYMLEDLHAYK